MIVVVKPPWPVDSNHTKDKARMHTPNQSAAIDEKPHEHTTKGHPSIGNGIAHGAPVQPSELTEEALDAHNKSPASVREQEVKAASARVAALQKAAKKLGFELPLERFAHEKHALPGWAEVRGICWKIIRSARGRTFMAMDQ